MMDSDIVTSESITYKYTLDRRISRDFTILDKYHKLLVCYAPVDNAFSNNLPNLTLIM